jgi:hypothetical protein
LVIDYEFLEKSARLGAAALETPIAAPSPRIDSLKENDKKPASTLSEAPESSRSSARPSASPVDAEALKDLIVKKDMELESLKNELRELRRQLDERDVQLEGVRKKAKPATKSPEALR